MCVADKQQLGEPKGLRMRTALLVTAVSVLLLGHSVRADVAEKTTKILFKEKLKLPGGGQNRWGVASWEKAKR